MGGVVPPPGRKCESKEYFVCQTLYQFKAALKSTNFLVH